MTKPATFNIYNLCNKIIHHSWIERIELWFILRNDKKRINSDVCICDGIESTSLNGTIGCALRIRKLNYTKNIYLKENSKTSIIKFYTVMRNNNKNISISCLRPSSLIQTTSFLKHDIHISSGMELTRPLHSNRRSQQPQSKAFIHTYIYVALSYRIMMRRGYKRNQRPYDIELGSAPWSSHIFDWQGYNFLFEILLKLNVTTK